MRMSFTYCNNRNEMHFACLHHNTWIRLQAYAASNRNYKSLLKSVCHHHYVRTYVLDNRHENRILGIESSWWPGCISLFGAMVARVVDVVILVIVWVTNDNSLCHGRVQHFTFHPESHRPRGELSISKKS